MSSSEQDGSRVRDAWRAGALPALLATTGMALALVVADLLRRRDDIEALLGSAWDVDRDRSYIEVLGYAVVLAAAVVIAVTARGGHRAVVLWGWTLLLVVLVADDGLMWHERWGGAMAARLDLPQWLGLREQDLGELTVWGLLGLGCLGLVVTLHVRSGRPARRWSWALAGSMVLLVLPAAGADMLQVAVADDVSYRVGTLLIYLEAVGEVVGMGLVLAVVLYLRHTVPLTEPSAGPGGAVVTAAAGVGPTG